MTATLRTMLLQDLPTDEDRLQLLFQDAAAWIARSYASSISEASDSTVDTHLAMISTLTTLNKFVYRDDFTTELPELIEGWLDDEYAAQDFYMSSFDANISRDSQYMPPLFGYFTSNSDALYS